MNIKKNKLHAFIYHLLKAFKKTHGSVIHHTSLAAATALASFAAATVDALVALVGWIKTVEPGPLKMGGEVSPLGSKRKFRNGHQHFLRTNC